MSLRMRRSIVVVLALVEFGVLSTGLMWVIA